MRGPLRLNSGRGETPSPINRGQPSGNRLETHPISSDIKKEKGNWWRLTVGGSLGL